MQLQIRRLGVRGRQFQQRQSVAQLCLAAIVLGLEPSTNFVQDFAF